MCLVTCFVSQVTISIIFDFRFLCHRYKLYNGDTQLVPGILGSCILIIRFAGPDRLFVQHIVAQAFCMPSSPFLFLQRLSLLKLQILDESDESDDDVYNGLQEDELVDRIEAGKRRIMT